MRKIQILKSVLAGGVSALVLASAAHADDFNIPAGDLKAALNSFAAQTGLNLIVSDDVVRGAHTTGAHGDFTASVALTRILQGTGLAPRRTSYGAVAIVQAPVVRETARTADASATRLASAAAANVETVVVTSSKIKGDIQTVPIAITALSQEQLTTRQIAGGPDLVKEVPNLTFSKTNFTGYNIEIRGIGTQAISVTTDPAVAVAFNDVPFIRNHFFEQEFYDVSQVEVLRGPQGTLYGRNATAGVVNVISAKPTDQFEAMLSADYGNYTNRRYEGMVNIPIVDDRLDLRIAGEWTKRDGYTFNETTGKPIDGRDLWSSRVTLGWKPLASLQTYLVWEHFQEDDDRLRSGKQLCTTSHPPASVDGVSLGGQGGGVFGNAQYLSQGCQMGPLYGPEAFQVPNGQSLPYYMAGVNLGGLVNGNVNPYADTVQSQNYRVIQSELKPSYKAKSDTLEFNADYQVTPALTFTSQTGYNRDTLWSIEDYNRFNSTPDVFQQPSKIPSLVVPDGNYRCNFGTLVNSPTALPGCGSGGGAGVTGLFCDPQLGCSSKLLAEDLSEEHSWQLSQEFRLASNFSGPFNFSVGGNYLHYETEENYYVFINELTMFSVWTSQAQGYVYVPGVSDNTNNAPPGRYLDPNSLSGYNYGSDYIDPNPIGSLNNQGHNYFLSQNPYVLNSYAAFGEAYYQILDDLKLTTGVRFTDDQKHFTLIPSMVVLTGYGYPVAGIVDQKWDQFTGREVLDWTPKLDFTDQTLFYGSYAHGYKAGGANPPGALLPNIAIAQPVHPLTFKPEFVEAFELGTKNTLLDGGLTLNGDIFFYDYKNYQISQIVDRTSVNLNFNANVRGAEVEAAWEPAPGLRFNLAGGYEDAVLDKGAQAVDLMDRTAGDPNWIVVKPWPTQASNCILPAQAVALIIADTLTFLGQGIEGLGSCSDAYIYRLDPVTGKSYVANPADDSRNNPLNQVGQDALHQYAGFDPTTAPNGGAGIAKDLSGNQLPSAPHFTTSFSAEYTMPVSADWAATLHGDFYWQSQSFARVFNDVPYDKIRGYSNVNLSLILTNANGWQAMIYDKNVFNTTAITGDFLNSDDSGLTTNVFLTDPRLFGVRVTKNW